jgi:hypothetical protein
MKARRFLEQSAAFDPEQLLIVTEALRAHGSRWKLDTPMRVRAKQRG